MKKLILAAAALAVFAVPLFAEEKKVLTVYTYESMGWLSDKAVPQFEKANNCAVKIVKFADAGNIVARLKLEKSRPAADVAVGLTQPLVILAKKNALIEAYRSKNIVNVDQKELLFDADFAAPYDYGALAFVYQPEKLKKTPQSLEDLKALKKSIILEDPRASSTGQDFLLWTISVYGKNWKDFWRAFKPSVLTVAPGWGEAFAKFEAGEAPIMLSYATDGAYAWHNYKSTKYKAFIPSEGGYLQIEASCVVKNAKQKVLAQAFVDFMLDASVQKEIPLNQWMFPATNAALPDAFSYAVRPKKILTLSEKEISDNLETWLREWEELFR